MRKKTLPGLGVRGKTLRHQTILHIQLESIEGFKANVGKGQSDEVLGSSPFSVENKTAVREHGKR